jgi:hypothetical protein
MTRRLVLEPGLQFVELDAVLSSHGWSGGPAVTFAPLVPGEPELARWTKQSAALDYACNPAIWFRTLDGRDVSDADWSALTVELRHVDGAAAVALLDEPFEESVLVGLFAVRALGATDADGRVERLASDPRPLVRELALQVRAEWAG